MRRRLAVAAAALVASIALPCAADDAAEAEKLFRRGKHLYGEGKLDEACAALAESDRLDPAVGTLGMLAACDERRGRLFAAMKAYREVARRAARLRDDRADFATRRADALDLRVPRLTLQIADPRSEVLVDGRPLEGAERAAPLRRDPGPVSIVARHFDGTTFRHEAILAEGGSLVIAIPAPAAPREAPATSPAHDGPPWIAIGSLGVGVVGLGVMTGFGLAASSLDADSEALEDACRGGSQSACDRGAALRGDAEDAAAVATVGLAIGVVGVAAGATIWLLTGDAAPASASLHRRGVALRF